MSAPRSASTSAAATSADETADARRQKILLKAGALQSAILTSANFAIIATDEKGIIQLFNVGAERMLGYKAADVVNKISPSDFHDPREVSARAAALSDELATSVAPGFEALVFSRRWCSRLHAGWTTFTRRPTSAGTAAAFRPSYRSRRCATTTATSSAT